MKLFGLEFSFKRQKKNKTTSGISASDRITLRELSLDKLPSKTTIQPSLVPQILSPALSFGQMYGQRRGEFLPPEYDLSEISIIADTDSFVRQSFEKKLGLMFKEGFDFVGPNKTSIRYIKLRFAQMAQASGIPTQDLLRRIAQSLIYTSNAFLVKVRDPRASGGRPIRTPDNFILPPVAAYFPAAAETMSQQIDQDTGRILGWKQQLPDGTYREFAPENVVHFHLSRREGFLYGVPSLIPVIDDIRALRQIEENLELLLYQHLFPLFHYRVGTETAPAGYAEDGRREIDIVKEQIRIMPAEGMIVTPERHEIRNVGSESRALRAEGYLDHFKKRVIAGLGVSSIDLGEGDSTNKATAFTLSRALVDAVKSTQDCFESQFNQLIINELLLESTFPDPLNEDNIVRLKFAEIDLQNKIEQENHSIEVFKANGLTFDEFRKELGKEPIPVPDDPENQDPAKFPEWFNTNWKLFEEPSLLIKAVDEPYSPKAIAAAEARSTALTQKSLQQGEAGKEREAKREQETQIAVAKASSQNRPKPKDYLTEDSFLSRSFSSLEEDVVNSDRSNNSISIYVNLWKTDNAEKLNALSSSLFIQSFNSNSMQPAAFHPELIQNGRSQISDRINKYVGKLARNLESRLLREGVDADEIRATFDALRYRINYIAEVESTKAKHLGQIMAFRASGLSMFAVKSPDDACNVCKMHANKPSLLLAADAEDLPPLHPNCNCYVEPHNTFQESAAVVSRTDSVVTIEDAPPADKLERCVLGVKESLRKRNPSWDEKKIKSSAYAICNAQLDDEEEAEEDPKEKGPAGMEEVTASCPSCGKTAIWQNRTGKFYCNLCNLAFDRGDDDE